MPQSITIRTGIADDAAAIAAILLQSGWFSYFSEESRQVDAERIEAFLESSYTEADSRSVYVAETESGIVVGYCTVQWLPYLFLPVPEGYVSELFVDDAWRGQGIGQRLIETVEREARERGCSRLMLCNGRSRDSYKRGFYQKLGWQERESVANFIFKL